MYLIDSDVIIDLLRKRTKASLPFYHQMSFISAISVFEVEYGWLRRPESELNQRPIFNALLKKVRILRVSEALRDTFSSSKKRLFDDNNLIEDPDIIIGSQAIYHNLTLITRNLKHFKRIPGIDILDFSPYLESKNTFVSLTT